MVTSHTKLVLKYINELLELIKTCKLITSCHIRIQVEINYLQKGKVGKLLITWYKKVSTSFTRLKELAE